MIEELSCARAVILLHFIHDLPTQTTDLTVHKLAAEAGCNRLKLVQIESGLN